tara:strand:- start:1762 stop:2481 length:720 start_codon:yes stop_codon:yes gene_type:complete
MLSNISVVSSAITGLTNVFCIKQEKNMVLDPLTCIIRLAILSFKPIGTKISINNNRITYCEPSIFQGTLRLAFGDNREDLHNIYNPIKKATLWFKNTDNNINNLFNYAIKGIKLLRDSYSKNSTIYHTLKLYQDLIKINLKNKQNTKQCLTADETEDESNAEDKAKKIELNKIYLKLKNLWNQRELSIVNNLIIELKNKIDNKNDNQEEIDAIFHALELILKVKESLVSKIILEETTIL